MVDENIKTSYVPVQFPRALSDAREGGAKLAVFPTRDSHSALCQKLSLKPYCQFNIYAWPSTPPKIPVC